MIETIKFLTACALVEEAAANIYREMSTAARDIKDEELSLIWTEMAKDEEDHAQQLRMAARLSRNDVFDETKCNFVADPAALSAQAASFLEMIVAGQLTELDMLNIASELEKKFCQLHVSCSLAFKEESLKNMFKALARADDKHVAKLNARINAAFP